MSMKENPCKELDFAPQWIEDVLPPEVPTGRRIIDRFGTWKVCPQCIGLGVQAGPDGWDVVCEPCNATGLV